MDTMNTSDRRSYEIALLIADKLEARPNDVLATGLRNIEAWSARSGRHAHLEEWRRIIEQGPQVVRSVLLEKSERAQELRSSSPFAGVLSESERVSVIQRIREAQY